LIGIDIEPNCANLRFDDSRIRVLVHDASRHEAAALTSQITTSLGIIIDDGSHVSSDIIKSFLLFFPQLKPGGLYLIEDLHASYWLDWEGGLSHPSSSMQFLKLLVDVVNFDHWGIDSKRADLFSLIDATTGIILESTLAEIHSVQFMDSVCVIRKKEESQIRLGPRIVSGSEAMVSDHVYLIRGKPSSPPPQNKNTFSRPSDLSLNWADRLNRLNHGLLAQNRGLTRQVDQLTAKFEEAKTRLKEETALVQAFQNSLSWRLTKPLRSLIALGERLMRTRPTRKSH
jgi:hypothetical protein